MDRAVLNFLLRHLAKGRLSVFLFHKVPNQYNPMTPLDLDLQTFTNIIDFIEHYFNVIPLNDGVASIKSGYLPERSACITFDDGYPGWMQGVVPVLERRNLHATFFITSGQLSGAAMWHERVVCAVRCAIGHTLHLPGFGLPPLSIASVSDRQKTSSLVEDFLKYQPQPLRDELIQRLEQVVGVSAAAVPKMAVSDLRALHSRGFGIGAHTINHPILTLCDEEQAVHEIGAVREELSSIVGGNVKSFAYPNGRPITDFNADHVRMVERAGYTSAVTTQWGSACIHTPVFQIPRFTPWGPRPINMALQLARNLLIRPRLIPRRQTRSVKVMFVENGAGFGGAVVALQTLLAHLPPEKLTCDVVTNFPVGQFNMLPSVHSHQVISDTIVDVRPLANRVSLRVPKFLSKPLLFGLGRFDDLVNRLPYMLHLAWHVFLLKPDIIHGNNEPISNREVMWVAKFFCKPYIQHLRGALGVSRTALALLAKPNFFIPVSRWLAADLMCSGVPVEHIRQIYDAVQIEPYLAKTTHGTLRHEFSIPADTLIVAMIGMFVSWKGQDIFIDAVKQLGNTERDVAYLIIGGIPENGEKSFSDSLRRQAAQHGILDRLIFTGKRDDIPVLLTEIDIVVSASTNPEPLGLVMLEAMVNGCVFIAPAHGAATEVIVDGQNGFLFAPKSAESLAEKLRCAIACTDNSDALTERARIMVSEQFTGAHCANATFSLYQSIFDGLHKSNSISAKN